MRKCFLAGFLYRYGLIFTSRENDLLRRSGGLGRSRMACKLQVGHHWFNERISGDWWDLECVSVYERSLAKGVRNKHQRHLCKPSLFVSKMSNLTV